MHGSMPVDRKWVVRENRYKRYDYVEWVGGCRVVGIVKLQPRTREHQFMIWSGWRMMTA